MAKVGALGPLEGATPEILSLTHQMKPLAERAAGKTFAIFYPVLLRSQLVSGMNHYIKVHVGDGQYVHVGVNEIGLGNDHIKLTFLGINMGKTLDDNIEHVASD